ncbi:MAG: putative antitoxin [Pedosphaera sp.]|nr:putative antitoxin [Pedosphaera sp.]
MGKTITIEDDAYQLLRSLKQGPGDSFTKVIRRHVHSPAKTNAELLEYYESQPPPDVDWEILERIAKTRGRRSGGANR